MWSPADKRAIPSKEDSIQANIAIKHVKIEIEETEVQLAQIQLKLDMLRKDLAEREAWLAPIRKLSHDELTIIFNMCAEDNWTALICLAAVCGTWRDAILANSQAWSCIHLSPSRALKLVPLYVERSGPRMLRIGSTYPVYYAPITQMAHRIQCLTIPTFSTQFDSITFPFLNQLYLLAEVDPMTILRLSRPRFPALRRLDVHFLEKASLRFDDGTVDLPQPQTLSLSSYPGVNLMLILHKYG
jgi:hypothetical protein